MKVGRAVLVEEMVMRVKMDIKRMKTMGATRFLKQISIS